MKKATLRKWGLVLLGAMMVSSMSACGSKDEGTTTPTVAPTATTAPVQDDNAGTTTPDVEPTTAPVEEEPGFEVRKDANGNPIDLGGMVVEIRSWYETYYDEPTNAYGEARLEFLEWAQETYNFTLQETVIGTYDTVPADFSNYANSADDGKNYLFIIRNDSSVISAIQNGLVHDLSKFDCLDFTEEKWNKATQELYNFGGKQYAMYAADNEPRFGVYFNKRLLNEAGINPEELYELQEKGEWTFAKCEEIMAKVHRDLDSDGLIDVYGTVNNNANVYKEAVFSNGGQFIGKDENGKFTYTLEDEATMEGLNWAHDIIAKYGYPQPDGANWDWFMAVFKNGDAAFCFDEAYMAGSNWANMEDEFGFLCFPKGPKAEDYTNVYSNNLVVIPSCYSEDKAWKLAFAYDIFTSAVPGYEDYDGWKSGYLSQFRDLESVELTLARMVENGVADFSSVVPGLEIGPDFLWNLGWWTTPAAETEKTRPVWQADIENANK